MCVIRVQKPAPEFTATALMPDGTFKSIANKDFAGEYYVLFFYPLDFTFVCPTEIIAYSDRIAEFEALKCKVVACSIDSEFTHLAWTQQDRKKGGLGKMNIPIIADVKRDVCEKFGVLLDDGVAARGLFIVDGKGIVRHITINDLPVGRSVDETLRVVKAFQFTDVHGEVCPANWQPGQKTMKADPVGSQAYFEKSA